MMAKELGYECCHIDASSKRSKHIITGMLKELSSCSTMSHWYKKSINKKTIILMDEVDGCSGSVDRGGVQALVKIIKVTQMPIVCIANDHGSRKIGALLS